MAIFNSYVSLPEGIVSQFPIAILQLEVNQMSYPIATNVPHWTAMKLSCQLARRNWAAGGLAPVAMLVLPPKSEKVP